MAGNKVNAKAKGKDDRGKGSSKSIVPNNDETEDTDFSLLRKPIQTSITGFAQARKIFDMATEELKGLLSDECDLLYECKVCRNLFRSLANFISHKRVYCQNKFNSTVHGHFIKSSSTLNELTKIKRIEKGFQDSLKEINDSEVLDGDERIPLTKDLTTIIEKIAKNKGISEDNDDEPQVTLQKISSSAVAVFQSVDKDERDSENMKNQVLELDDILSRNIAVLQSDGKFKIESSVPNESTESHTEAVIQISDDEESGNTDSLKCKKCDMRFSTQKTLRFHMKYKHVDTRVVYPCPDCLEIFSTSWSVYRHLFKVHRKTAAQIRRLRESIQAKAFKMNNPPAFYEKRKNMKTAQVPKITEEERLDQENQAWMDNMESSGGVPRCGGCGRAFERRAALAAHTHTCQPRSRALRRPDNKRIEIQIRKDYHKGPAGPPLPLAAATALASLLQDGKAPKTKETLEPKEVQEEEVEDQPKIKCRKEADPEELPEPKEVVKEASPEPATQDEQNEPESKSSSVSPEKVEDERPPAEAQVKPVRLPFAQHAEKSNLMALRQRIIPDIELETLRCKKCDTQCNHIQELYDHVAKHYNWMRYACKLCNFKHYNFEKLPEHVKIIHKLKGDKDFYFSTVKAIDGAEASELATPVEESTEAEESSSNSRRPSRCSSDSSRLSDDSSSSSTRVEGAKKRKMTHKMPSKGIGKRRKSVKGIREDDEEWTDKDDSQSNVKTIEENSSDIDDTYERIAKTRIEESVASRRPVRRKAKPKNEDFEYDLSNLLKMEAQGYRESQTSTSTTKSSQTKKKVPQPDISNYEMLNKECCGALVSLSRKAVENAKAHMKTSATLYIQREKLPSSIFARPMVPKGLTRGEKVSPKKEVIEEKKDSPSSNKETSNEMPAETEKRTTDTNSKNIENDATSNKESIPTVKSSDNSKNIEVSETANCGNTGTEQNKESSDTSIISNEVTKPKSITIPSVMPLKFRRQSIEVIKNNPIINKNITEFSKAGMKTKILVIKPIHRKKDGAQTVNTPLKFQTIKLKETSKNASNEDKSTDQVVVVKVPKVDCINRGVSDTTKASSENISSVKRTEITLTAPDETTIGHEQAQLTADSSNNMKMHSDKNGDVKIKKSEPMDIDPMKASDDVKFKSNLSDSANNCDSNEMNSENNTKNVLAIASNKLADAAETVENSANLMCE